MTRSGPVVEFVVPKDALATISTAIQQAKGGDVLAPVWVIAPTDAAVNSLTDQLARHAGLINVRVVTLSRLADHLVEQAGTKLAPRLRGHFSREITRQIAVDAKAPLNNYAPDVLARSLTPAFEDLRTRPESEIALVSESSALAHETVRLYKAFRDRVSQTFVDRQDLLVAARSAATSSTTPVVAIVAEPLSFAESELFVALAQADRLKVVALRSGDEALDTAVNPWLWGLGETQQTDATGTPTAQVLYEVPDADIEIEVAIAELLAAAEQGIPFSRMAILFGSSVQYARIVEDQLRLAGIPSRGRLSTQLSQSVAGGFISSLFDVLESTPTIATVSAWLLGYAIRDDLTLQPAPTADWLHAARTAKVTGEFANWQHRLNKLGSKMPAAKDFADFLTRFDEWSRQRPTKWSEWVAWLQHAVETYLGSHSDREDWAPAQAKAAKAIESKLAHIAQLDSISTSTTQQQFIQAVREELVDEAASTASRHGVFVGTIGEAEGCAFDVSILCGLAEGKFPRGSGRSGLLDALRVPDEEITADRDRRSFLLRLNSGGRVVVTYPLADSRTQRPVHPSHVLNEIIIEETKRVDSFSSLLHSDSLRSSATFDRMTLINSRISRGESTSQVFAELDAAAFDRGVHVLRERDGETFGEFDGFVDAALTSALFDTTHKPTDLELWAKCPFAYFLKSVLRVGVTEDESLELSIDPPTKGLLIHDVLDKFIKSVPRRESPESKWTSDERKQLHQLTDQSFAALQDEGIVARGILAKRELKALHEHLERILDVDEKYRASKGVVPVATELSFGFDGDVGVTLDNGTRVNFRGRIDRVDASPSGDRVIVTDYKSAKPFSLKGDVTDRGKRLQSVIYAVAAQQQYPDAEVSSDYWFVTDKAGGYSKTSIDLNDETLERLHDVLEVLGDNLATGSFPATPGLETIDSFENCRFCDYASLCPVDKSESWNRKSNDERVARLRRLQDGETDD